MGYEVEERIIELYAQHLLRKLVDAIEERFGTYVEKSLDLHAKFKKPKIQKKKTIISKAKPSSEGKRKQVIFVNVEGDEEIEFNEFVKEVKAKLAKATKVTKEKPFGGGKSSKKPKSFGIDEVMKQEKFEVKHPMSLNEITNEVLFLNVDLLMYLFSYLPLLPLTTSLNRTFERYKRIHSKEKEFEANANSNIEQWKVEVTRLRHQVNTLINEKRNLEGENISSLDINQLKQLEIYLKQGLDRIRSKKDNMIFQEIATIQQRERFLLAQNQQLRDKITQIENAKLTNALQCSNNFLLQANVNKSTMNGDLIKMVHNYPSEDSTSTHTTLQLGGAHY
ncbi:uncharacterized protein LOC131030201 [Cryptomeria japonica]|uniref:uncharacterized protein LOC131030201 n=1 Tax=Cryptomeria japonica TaxID=3369 RepID=UPI0027D9FD36|nr:uncharacterized protein LOC131030201 [Cryptomeria japonica]